MTASPPLAKVALRGLQVLPWVFLALLASLHVLEPEFDPTWRMISEYALGRFGWMMSLAFFCWSASVLSLLIATWPLLHGIRGGLARAWLLVLAVALVGAGVFQTNPILDPTPRTAHQIHSLCGAVVILTFPGAASLLTALLSAPSARLRWMTRANWLSLLAFFGSIIVSRMLHPDAGRVGPEVWLGWPNRAMVVVYQAWLLVVAGQLAKSRSGG